MLVNYRGHGPAYEYSCHFQCHSIEENSCSLYHYISNNFCLGAAFCVHFPFSVVGFFWLEPVQVLCVHHRLYEFVCDPALSYLEDVLSLELFTISTLLPHSSLSLEGRASVKTVHLGLSAPKSLTLCTLPNSGSLKKRNFADEG